MLGGQIGQLRRSCGSSSGFVDELARLRNALGLKEVHILGHSCGTMLAADYMLTKPTGVRSLVMASPSLSMSRWLRDAETLKGTLPDLV